MEQIIPPDIGKQYIILQPLAQGKFGNVFLGKSKKTEETIIVKQGISPQTQPQTQSNTLKPKTSGGTAAVETIRHEAEILTFLNQDVQCRKHIPFIHWYGLCSKGVYCIAMSYIPTTPLRPFSNDIHPIDYETQLQQMIREIVQAFKAIHQKGILHRDLKPENILYHQSKRRWYLIDFGLATFYQDEEGNHKPPPNPPRKHIIGTPNFVSCFIHECQEPSRRDDLIALGNVAWWLRNNGSWSPTHESPLSWEQTLEYKTQLVREPISLEKNPQNMFRIKLATFIKKCYTLGFMETPPYDMISNFFQ
jgi:serine/threonine protein kinase